MVLISLPMSRRVSFLPHKEERSLRGLGCHTAPPSFRRFWTYIFDQCKNVANERQIRCRNHSNVIFSSIHLAPKYMQFCGHCIQHCYRKKQFNASYGQSKVACGKIPANCSIIPPSSQRKSHVNPIA